MDAINVPVDASVKRAKYSSRYAMMPPTSDG